MTILRKTIISLFLMFTSIVVNADNLDDFISTLSEQTILTYWVYNNSIDTVTTDKAAVIVKSVYVNATNQNMNPHLILAVIKTESRFNEKAESSEGAKGLMQVMPKFHKDKLKGRNTKNIDVSIEVGSMVLNECLKKHHHKLDKGLNCYSGSSTSTYRKVVMANKASLTKYLQQFYHRTQVASL